MKRNKIHMDTQNGTEPLHGSSPARRYPFFPCLYIHSREKFISSIYISERERLGK